MVGTAAVKAKKALFDMLAAQTGVGAPLAGVQVSYSWPGKRLEKEHIYFGKLHFDQEYSTFASAAVGGGRQPRAEYATVTFYVAAKNIRSDQYAADLRVVELGEVAENLIAADPTGGGQFQVITVDSGDIEPALDDDAVWSEMTYTVAFQSELI
jgi:hypothetical protein